LIKVIFGELHSYFLIRSNLFISILFAALQRSYRRHRLRWNVSGKCVLDSIPVVPKVWIASQKRVAKGKKMGRAEAIQN